MSHPFDMAPAFIEANTNVVWRGTVSELRRITKPSSDLGWPSAEAALQECVDDWMRDRKPSEPRPWCIRRPAVELPGLSIFVGVGSL